MKSQNKCYKLILLLPLFHLLAYLRNVCCNLKIAVFLDFLFGDATLLLIQTIIEQYRYTIGDRT